MAPNASTQILDDTLLGTVIQDRYRLTQPIGEGTYARVYEARHQHIDSLRFAVKVLKPAYAHHPEILQRFRTEAASVTQLQGRHVVRVFDTGVHPQGMPFIVMELVPGQSLRSLLGTMGRLNATRATVIALGVARALEEAHRLGVTHRDLKPANILVTQPRDENEPVAKVLDFAVASILGGDQALQHPGEDTLEGHLYCSPAYAAPELLRGKPSPTSDLYALGIIMAEMLEGAAPYSGEPGLVLAAMHLRDAAVPLGPAVRSSPLAAIIERACQKDLGLRYASATELVADLHELYLDLRSETAVGDLRIESLVQQRPSAASTNTRSPAQSGTYPAPAPTDPGTHARFAAGPPDADGLDDIPDTGALIHAFDIEVEVAVEGLAPVVQSPVVAEEDPSTFEVDNPYEGTPLPPSEDAGAEADESTRRRAAPARWIAAAIALAALGGGLWWVQRGDPTPDVATSTAPTPATPAAAEETVAPATPSAAEQGVNGGDAARARAEALAEAEHHVANALFFPEPFRYNVSSTVPGALAFRGQTTLRPLPWRDAFGPAERPITLRFVAPNYPAIEVTVTEGGAVVLQAQFSQDVQRVETLPTLERPAPPVRRTLPPPTQPAAPAAQPPQPAASQPQPAVAPPPAQPTAPVESPPPPAPDPPPAQARPAPEPEAQPPRESAPAFRHHDLRNPFDE